MTRLEEIVKLACGGKMPKKELGGDFIENLAPIISLIPGGNLIGTGLDLVNTLHNPSQESTRPYKLNQMELGGDFKQYNALSHDQGGQMIDKNGHPTKSNGIAEIEKQENSHRGYVYSDKLINPDTNNTYAKDAAMINKKTKAKDDITQESKILQLLKLRQKNEMAREQEATSDTIPQAANGLPLDSLFGAATTIQNRFGVPPTIGTSPLPSSLTSITPPSANVLSTLPVPKTPKVEFPEEASLNLNPIAAGLKAASLVASGVDALQGSEQEKLQLPDYSKGDQYFQGLEIDMAPILGEINMAATKATNDVSNQAGGIGARNSRVNSILARAGKNSALAQLQQQQANSQIRSQIGAREDIKSNTTAAERIRQQIAQSQNDATSRLAGRKFFSDLSQVGTTLNNIQYANDLMKNQNELGQQSIQYGLAMLSQKYPDFKPSDEFIERLRTGTLLDSDKSVLDQLIKFAS